jgi:hypothetical protein
MIIIIIVLLALILYWLYPNICQILNKVGSAESANIFDILEYLESASIDDIEKNIVPQLKNDVVCDKFIGEGYMGIVSESAIGPTVKMMIGKKEIEIPVVIKKSKKNSESIFGTYKGKTRLIVYSFQDITAEAIILLAIKRLWVKQESPHLPLMVGYGTCGDNFINTIITEKQGLKEEYVYPKDYVDDSPLYIENSKTEPNIRTSMTTLRELLYFVMANLESRNTSLESRNTFLDGDKCVLPNGVVCDVPKLVDYICISYLHTYNLLFDNGIALFDMSLDNIFIHWLNDSSYMGERNIKNTEFIYYKSNTTQKYIEINTYGFLLKVGDIGCSIYKIRDDLFVLGMAGNPRLCDDIIDDIYNKVYTYGSFLFSVNMFLTPHNIRTKTNIYEIICNPPFDGYLFNYTPTKRIMKSIPSPNELLSKFTKYMVDEPQKNDKSIII